MLSIPVIILGGIYGGIFTPTEAGAAGALAAGRMSRAQTAPTPGVPAWEMSLPLVAKVALDEAVLGSFHLRIRFPRGRVTPRLPFRMVEAAVCQVARQGVKSS